MQIKKMSEMGNETSPVDVENQYPWGTSLHLDDDMVKELGLDKMQAGTTVNLTATAFIERKSTEEEAGEDPEHRVCLQLTELNVKRSSTNGERATLLYGDSDGE